MILPRDRVSLVAPAKVNLFLRITGRRADGYHNLATLMQKISLYDRLELERTPAGITLHCPDSTLPEDASNLAFRAAERFFQVQGPRLHGRGAGVVITLRKSIPEAAGLGGGSSDAGAVLRGLDQLFATACSEKELLDMGRPLGADVPFFVTDHPAVWATGIGDRLQPVTPLDGYVILVVNPGFSVSTRWVYEKFALTAGKNINNLQNLQNSGLGDGGSHPFLSRSIRPDELVNDLETVTASHHGEIDQLKTRLRSCGAVAAMMSGSGPTVFGLFEAKEAERAAACARELKKLYSETCLAEPLQT